jgi:hypothetical protein
VRLLESGNSEGLFREIERNSRVSLEEQNEFKPESVSTIVVVGVVGVVDFTKEGGVDFDFVDSRSRLWGWLERRHLLPPAPATSPLFFR